VDRIDQYPHDGLTFDVSDSGPVGARVVILLHGFPEDRHCWAEVGGALNTAGCRALAPDQRGYSPGARPAGRRAYTLDHLAGDVLALADAAGAARFDVVGHDFGASVAWYLAGHYPERIRSLTALSVPHPQAFAEALGRSSQALRSWYLLFFQLPGLPEQALRRSRLVAGLRGTGLDEASARRYAARAATPGAMTGPLNWYRAIPLQLRGRPGPVNTPALYIWGDGDRFVTRVAAEGCGHHVTGPYRFIPLAGASHWLPSTSAGEITPPLLEHLAAFTD
jgi:pimeloyl-ACP methyl ester carboxylesterase